jgi:DNA topoisomerase-1
MEDELDGIATGRQQRSRWLSEFYFGGESHGSVKDDGDGGEVGLKELVGSSVQNVDAREINSIPLFKDADDREVVVRVGRYGPYLEREVDGKSQRASLPDGIPPDELTLEIAEKQFAMPQDGRSLGNDPVSGREVVAKDGRFGPYVTELLSEEEAALKGAKKIKPRTGSLLKSMSLETVTLDDALRLMALPRVVGTDPGSGEEITAQNGRYGPYLKKGTDSRSLGGEEEIFTVTLEEALKLYAEPKKRGRAATAAPPLREMGNDSASGKAMVVKNGRFGPYVTDGETNASLRKSDSVEELTDERASELLAERRAKGPAPKKRATTTRKKAPAKAKAKS